jgi:ABC-type spermidine/putrescine transport system permease subunit I
MSASVAWREMFEGCIERLPDLCVTLKTYLSALKFSAAVWLITLMVGFFIAYLQAKAIAFGVADPSPLPCGER